MDRRWFLALAALLVSAAWYDGASTVFFLSQNRYMAEQNPLFGKHPSPERIFAEGGAIVACELAFAWWTIGRGRRWAWVWAILWLQVAAHFWMGYRNFLTSHHGW